MHQRSLARSHLQKATLMRAVPQDVGVRAAVLTVSTNAPPDFGAISPNGDNAPGFGFVTSPAACLVLGPGSYIIDATTGPMAIGRMQSPRVNATAGRVTIKLVTTGWGRVVPGAGCSACGVSVAPERRFRPGMSGEAISLAEWNRHSIAAPKCDYVESGPKV